MLTLVFAPPGAGKTTYACKVAFWQSIKSLYDKKGKRSYDYVYCNFAQSVPGVRTCSMDDIGKWTFPRNSLVIVDECGIEYNNRKYKSFTNEAIRWYKLHRHYGVDMLLISQDIDIDLTLLRLCENMWIMRRIGFFSILRHISRDLIEDKEKHTIVAGYFFAPVYQALLPFIFHSWKLIFRPFYYRFFDSWECDDLPVRDYADTENMFKKLKRRERRARRDLRALDRVRRA